MTPSNDPSQDSGSPAANDPAFGQRLMQAFDRIADLPETEREPALLTLCAEQPELEHALRALLARDAETGPLDATLSAQLQPLLREALPRLDPAPAQIGPYQVLRLLGEGGMGRVYLAKRSEGPVTREVAIKLIRPDRAGAGLLARFEAERRHLAALDHPGICRFIDADSLADGTPYVVMEAVQGEPIIEYCQRRGLGLRERVELLRQLLAAVAHAHDRLLLHRDLKPHNVLVTAEGLPKLLDFGIAKSIEEAEASVTRTAERFFTPNASAPEQLLGQPAGVACDVYSLGALAFELLSGALPFAFKDLRAAEIERLILQVAPPLMSERSTQPWARDLRGDLDAIIATCLRKSPGERYRNVDALDAELQRWLEGRPVTARVPSWGYRSRLFVRRHRTAVGLSVALGLAVIVFGTSLALQAVELSEQRNLAVVERDRALEVVEILESAFRSADPGQTAGDKVTARQILDAAVPSIDRLEESQPSLFARMAATLARVELSLNNWNNAAKWSERGLEYPEKHAADQKTIESLLFSGVMSNARLGRTDVSARQLAHYQALSNPNQIELALATARHLRSSSKFVEAEAVLMQAVENGPNDPLIEASHTLRWLLAESHASFGNHEAAKNLLDATVEWQATHLDHQHPFILITKMERARILARSQPTQELLSEISDLISRASVEFGAESLRTIYLKRALGQAQFKLGQEEIGLKNISEASYSHVRLLGPSSATAMQSEVQVAQYFLEEGSHGSLENALKLLTSVSARSFQVFTKDAPIAYLSKTLECNTLARLERWEESANCIFDAGIFTSNATRHASTRSTMEETIREVRQSSFCSSSSIDRCNFPSPPADLPPYPSTNSTTREK